MSALGLRRLLWGLGVSVLGLSALQAAFPAPAAHLPLWHRVPGAFGLFGLVACALLIVVPKAAASAGLATPDVPGDGEDDVDPAPPAHGDDGATASGQAKAPAAPATATERARARASAGKPRAKQQRRRRRRDRQP